ncbi:hypothetical protein Tco_0698516 [Tanacetum coccineum]
MNGNKVLKRTVGEVEQIYEPTSAKEKQDRKNEMKSRETLLMALPNKDQLKFHTYKDAKLLMEAIEKRYRGNKESKKVQRTLLKKKYENFVGSSSETLNQTFDRFQKLISQLEIQGEVIEQEDMNLKMLRSLLSEWKTHALIWRNKEETETISLDYFTNSTSSTNEADNTIYRVSAAHTQGKATSPVDNFGDVVICAFLIAQDGIRGYDWSYQAEEEHPTYYALMAYTSSGSSSNSDSEVDSCSKTCLKAYAILKEQYDILSSDYKKYQFNLVSYKACLQSLKARLAHYKKNEVVFEESINVLNLEVKLRDNVLVKNKKKLEKAKKKRDELKLTFEKFQNSSKSLNNFLKSQVSDKFKTGLGYNAASPTVESFMNSSEMLEYQENDKSKSNKGYHAVPPPYTVNYMPPKPDLMFMDEKVKSESVNVVSDVTPSYVKTVESKLESFDVKNKGVFNTVEPKTIRKNIFRPPIIKD